MEGMTPKSERQMDPLESTRILAALMSLTWNGSKIETSGGSWKNGCKLDLSKPRESHSR